MATATQIGASQGPRPLIAPGKQEFNRRVVSISGQSSVYFAGTIFTSAAGYFFKVYLARKLGAEALGIYALGMTIVGFLGLFNALGLPTAAARFVSAYASRGETLKLGSFLRGSLAILLATNIMLGVGVLAIGPWIAIHLYHLPSLSPYLWAFVSIMFFGVLNTFLGQVMAGYKDVARRTIVTNFVATPANMLFAVVLITFGLGLSGYLVAQVASGILVLILLARAAWKMTPQAARLVRSFHAEKEVFAFSAAAFATTALEFVLAQSDKIVLGCFLTAREVGIYAVASALIAFVPIALQSVNQIFSPTIAELHATGNWSMLQQLYSTLTKWILILTIPLALTLIFFSREFMAIFGAGFTAGGPVLVIGTIGQLFNCAVGSVGFLLLMSGNQRELLKIQAINSLVMVVLMIVLVHLMGMTGAAIATAFTVVTSNVWYLKAVRTKLGVFPFNAGYLKLFLPTLLSGFVLVAWGRWLNALSTNWKTAPLALMAAYVLFLGAISLFGLDARDREVGRLLLLKIRRPIRKSERYA